MRAAAVAGYVLLALAFTWPLLLHLSTHLTGPIGGDTGVYVWNQWVFRHELLNEHLPLFTREIFSLTRPANLSLHNYTIFQDLVALPLLGTFGIVATFNVVYLLMAVITGYVTAARVVARRRVVFVESLPGHARHGPFQSRRGSPAPDVRAAAAQMRRTSERRQCSGARRNGVLGCHDRSLLRHLLRHPGVRLRRRSGDPIRT